LQIAGLRKERAPLTRMDREESESQGRKDRVGGNYMLQKKKNERK